MKEGKIKCKFSKYSHRFSEDFDFFLFPEEKVDFFSFLGNFKPEKVIDLRDDTLIFILNGVKFSFFKYDYPFIKFPEWNSDYSIYIASDEDISAMKSIAVIQRGEKKDFFDLWFLMKKNKWKIHDIIGFSKEKYKTVFNPSLFLKAVVFFEDAEGQIIESIEPEWSGVKEFFKREVKSYIRKEL